MKYLAEMTFVEVQGLGPEALAILPIGAIEAHGPHLPLLTDVIIARGMAASAARALQARGFAEVVVAPPLQITPAAFAKGLRGHAFARARNRHRSSGGRDPESAPRGLRARGPGQRSSGSGTYRLSSRRRADGARDSRHPGHFPGYHAQALGPSSQSRVQEWGLPRRPIRNVHRHGGTTRPRSRIPSCRTSAESGLVIEGDQGGQEDVRGSRRPRGLFWFSSGSFGGRRSRNARSSGRDPGRCGGGGSRPRQGRMSHEIRG